MSNKNNSAEGKAQTCSFDVADFTGYHFHRCNKPAKWLVNDKLRCGIHAKGFYYKSIRTPIK